jgi:teichuronic acid biosynthesis glycosyltransferase TuaH
MENFTIENRDIVVLGLTPFEFDTDSNILNIAFELAKNNRVLFVNRATDRFSLVTGKDNPSIQRRLRVLKGKEPDLRQVKENFWNLYPKTVLESVNWVAVDFAFDYMNKVNNKRIARQISSAIEQLNFRDIILFNDNDFCRGLYMQELLKPSAYIYYLRDYLLNVDYWQKHGARLEKNILKQSDLVLTTNISLAEYASDYNPKTYCVGMGCQPTLEENSGTLEKPLLLSNLASPLIGYAGKLERSHFDTDMVLKLAEELKTANFIIVATDGIPEDNMLLGKNNIFVTTVKNNKELAEYVNQFDVCFIPKRLSSDGLDVFPKSIFEFFAHGKPVVSFFTRCLENYQHLIYQATDFEDFTDKLIDAVREKDEDIRSERRNLASRHTWADNVNGIYESMVKAGIKSGSSSKGKIVLA